jgi:hypothetical protein
MGDFNVSNVLGFTELSAVYIRFKVYNHTELECA